MANEEKQKLIEENRELKRKYEYTWFCPGQHGGAKSSAASVDGRSGAKSKEREKERKEKEKEREKKQEEPKKEKAKNSATAAACVRGDIYRKDTTTANAAKTAARDAITNIFLFSIDASDAIDVDVLANKVNELNRFLRIRRKGTMS